MTLSGKNKLAEQPEWKGVDGMISGFLIDYVVLLNESMVCANALSA